MNHRMNEYGKKMSSWIIQQAMHQEKEKVKEEEQLDRFLLEMEMEYGDETEEAGLEFLELNPQLRKGN